MLRLLWLIPALPLAGSILLALLGSRLPKRAVAVAGAGSIGGSSALAALVAWAFLSAPPQGNAYRQLLWTWINTGGFRTEIALYLDALSLLMALVVTFVSFLIHLYSTEYMEESEGYSRFFAYMNLFVGSMLVLVLADDLLLLFLGWEGVGLCSYLLIGFWYQEPANGRAAQKAFIVTRAGDTAFTIGLLLLFSHLGTLEIQELMRRAEQQWPAGTSLPILAAALLLGGAVGKSAQLPLQTWLPDAMAGPTPTSALIHAATMVTAGVYLIARAHALFTLAPQVLTAIAIVGAATLLMAGFSALTQEEIKRVLAYSTISQIGYMFLALGAGSWIAAMFHFMTHAFFKALLFLAAGVVIEALHHENNIFRMGGLRRLLPVAFWTFLIGGSALAGLPYVTSGYYSKDLIIWRALASEHGGPGLWVAALAGALLTSLYTFRVIFVVFFGEARGRVTKRPRWAMVTPLALLSVLSVAGGLVNLPPTIGDFRPFETFMATALPAPTTAEHSPISEAVSETAAAAVFLAGLLLAYIFFLRKPDLAEAAARSLAGRTLHRLWHSDWGMDWLYERLFVRPVIWVAQVNKADVVDAIYNGTASLTAAFYRWLSLTENGRVRWYAAGVAGGAILFLGVVLLS